MTCTADKQAVIALQLSKEINDLMVLQLQITAALQEESSISWLKIAGYNEELNIVLKRLCRKKHELEILFGF